LQGRVNVVPVQSAASLQYRRLLILAGHLHRTSAWFSVLGKLLCGVPDRDKVTVEGGPAPWGEYSSVNGERQPQTQTSNTQQTSGDKRTVCTKQRERPSGRLGTGGNLVAVVRWKFA